MVAFPDKLPKRIGRLGHTQDEWDLDLWQIKEILGNMDAELVQEGRCNVKSILDVVEHPLRVGHVLRTAHDGVVGTRVTQSALIELFGHVSSAGDIFLPLQYNALSGSKRPAPRLVGGTAGDQVSLRKDWEKLEKD